MKHLSILFAFLLFFAKAGYAQPCLPDGITFTTQGQIDSFSINYPGCTEIGGDVVISNYPSSNLITNLDGLSNITSLGGNLTISNNYKLTNLDGLTNLTSVVGDLFVTSIDALTNINGLANLASIGGRLGIANNFSLNDLGGLANLTSVGNLGIVENDALTNLNGLDNLTSIGENLEIAYNDILTDCCCIRDLLATPGAITGDIKIFNNPSECSNESEILAVDCVTTGQTPASKVAISIHPNPANNLIYISAKNQQSIDKILIYNNLGELVLAQKDEQVDVSHLPKGLYLVKVQAGKKMGVAQLIRL